MARIKNTPSDYVKYKTKILDELGLHNKSLVERRLQEVSKGCTKESAPYQIDMAARELLNAFYDGDKTYARYQKGGA